MKPLETDFLADFPEKRRQNRFAFKISQGNFFWWLLEPQETHSNRFHFCFNNVLCFSYCDLHCLHFIVNKVFCRWYSVTPKKPILTFDRTYLENFIWAYFRHFCYHQTTHYSLFFQVLGAFILFMNVKICFLPILVTLFDLR